MVVVSTFRTGVSQKHTVYFHHPHHHLNLHHQHHLRVLIFSVFVLMYWCLQLLSAYSNMCLHAGFGSSFLRTSCYKICRLCLLFPPCLKIMLHSNIHLVRKYIVKYLRCSKWFSIACRIPCPYEVIHLLCELRNNKARFYKLLTQG